MKTQTVKLGSKSIKFNYPTGKLYDARMSDRLLKIEEFDDLGELLEFAKTLAKTEKKTRVFTVELTAIKKGEHVDVAWIKYKIKGGKLTRLQFGY